MLTENDVCDREYVASREELEREAREAQIRMEDEQREAAIMAEATAYVTRNGGDVKRFRVEQVSNLLGILLPGSTKPAHFRKLENGSEDAA